MKPLRSVRLSELLADEVEGFSGCDTPSAEASRAALEPETGEESECLKD